MPIFDLINWYERVESAYGFLMSCDLRWQQVTTADFQNCRDGVAGLRGELQEALQRRGADPSLKKEAKYLLGYVLGAERIAEKLAEAFPRWRADQISATDYQI